VTPKRITVAVAGLGTIAETVHLPLLARRSDLFEVVAVADLSGSRVGRLADRYGVPPGRRRTGAAELLDDGGFDALLLLTSGSHGELAAAASRRGVPVLCEKPLALTRAEAADLAGLPAELLMVGYMKQYDPAVTELARQLAAIGGPAAVHAVDVTVLHPSGDAQLAFAHLPPPPDDLPADELTRLRELDDRLLRAAVGDDPAARALYQIMINSVSHDLSLLRLLTGGPATVDHVATWPAVPPPGHEPSVEVSGTLPDGGRYGIRWLYLPNYPGYRETVVLHHAHGSFELVFPSPYRLDAPTTLTVLDRCGDVRRQSVFRPTTGGFERELVALHGMVTEGGTPLTGVAGGAEDILTSQRVVRRFGALTGTAVGGEAAEA
jgi:myo-inositol 2-dehydrogenase/D-chiro-inositol 1-dehydrogenase